MANTNIKFGGFRQDNDNNFRHDAEDNLAFNIVAAQKVSDGTYTSLEDALRAIKANPTSAEVLATKQTLENTAVNDEVKRLKDEAVAKEVDHVKEKFLLKDNEKQKKMFESDKKLYAKLNAVKEGSDETQIPEADCEMVKAADALALRVTIKEGDVPFAFVIRGDKVTFASADVTLEQMRDFRAFMELRGIKGFSFEDGAEDKLKNTFKTVDDEIKRPRPDGKSFWDEWYESIQRGRGEEVPAEPEPTVQDDYAYDVSLRNIGHANTTDAAPSAIAAPKTKKKATESSTAKVGNAFSNYAKRQAKALGEDLELKGNWITGKKTLRIWNGPKYKDRAKGTWLREENEADLELVYKEKKVEGVKIGSIGIRTKNNEKIADGVADEIIGVFSSQGKKRVRLGSHLTDADKGILAKAAGRKGMIVTGIPIGVKRAKDMVNEYQGNGATTAQIQDYKLALAKQMRANVAESGKTLEESGLAEQIATFEGEVKYGRFNGSITPKVVDYIGKLKLGLDPKTGEPMASYNPKTGEKVGGADSVHIIAAGAAYTSLMKDYMTNPKVAAMIPGNEAGMMILFEQKIAENKEKIAKQIQEQGSSFTDVAAAVNAVRSVYQEEMKSVTDTINSECGATVRTIPLAGGVYKKAIYGNIEVMGKEDNNEDVSSHNEPSKPKRSSLPQGNPFEPRRQRA